MTQKSSTLDDFEGSLRTLLCQSRGVVAKRYVDDSIVGYGDDELQTVNSNHVCLQQFGRNFECNVVACSHHPCAHRIVSWR